jgi:subtilisin family serine protease
MDRKLRLPSAWLIAAVILLFVAIGGTAVAADRLDAAERGTALALRSETPAPSLVARPRAAFPHDPAAIGREAVPGLGSVVSRSARPGLSAAGIERTRSGAVRVIVQTGKPAAVRAAVLEAGGRVERAWRNLVQVTVPPTAVPTLSDLDAVDSVDTPARLVEYAVGGEEIEASLAAAWQAKKFTGKGVKVAVIDAGFAGLADRQAAGDLPANVVTNDFCGGHFGDATNHGSGVAEIVHEVAPDAQLFLICVSTVVDLAAAESFAKSQGVHVINFSAGFYNAGRGDGSGPLPAIVADARAAGILWVNAAGNEAQTHWAGTFNDSNGDLIHEFAAGDIGNTFVFPNGSIVCGALKWDEWPAASSDFDLYLIMSSTGEILGASFADQAGTQPPTEEACFQNESGSDLAVAWVIVGYRVTTAPRFDLFTDSPLQYQSPAGSIADPASAPAALAVGALCWQSRALEPYSSQGPTIDGRMKPELVGHDSVSGGTYGPFSSCPSAFAGTSASSPEVAGAAALVKQAFPRFTPDQLQSFIVRAARDLGAPGADNATGAGEVQLRTPPDQVAPAGKALPSAGQAGKVVKLLARASDDSGRVRVTEQVKRNGKVIATLRSSFAAAVNSRTFSTSWRAPKNAAGSFQHCVRAADKAGNTSKQTCARVTLR